MYDQLKSQPVGHSLNEHHPNLRAPRTAQASKFSFEDSHILQSARCIGDSLGCELNLESPCYLHLQTPNAIHKVECPSGPRDFAAERVERMNERVRDLRRFLEAGSQNVARPVDTCKSGGVPELKTVTYVEDASNLDITLRYETYSDSNIFSSDSTGLSAFDDTPPNCVVESQTANLRGVGQWVDGLQSGSDKSWQDSLTSMGVAEDPALDLTGVHVMATTSPFEHYFHARRGEEGALNFQLYSLLP